MGKTFEELKTSIKDWLGVTDEELPDTVRGDIINMVQRRFMRQYETRFGEFSDTFQTEKEIRDYDLIVGNTGGNGKATGYSRPLSIWYLTPETGEIVYLAQVNKAQFDALFPASGLYGVPAPPGAGTFGQTLLGDPTHYTIWANKLQLGKVPNRAAPGLTIYRNYWRWLPDLVNGTPTNTNQFIEQAWEYLLFGSLVEATKYGIEDERIPVWTTMRDDLEESLISEYARSQISGRVSQSTEPG